MRASRRPACRAVLVGLVFLLSGCPAGQPRVSAAPDGGTDAVPAPALVRNFLSTTPVASCQHSAGPGWVRSVTPAAGGRFLALLEDGARVHLLDRTLRIVSTRGLPVAPPGGILDPVDAWLLGDTLVVADGRGRALHRRPWAEIDGAFERSPLPFIPHGLVPVGSHVGVIPLGGGGGTMLFVQEPGGLRSLPLPPPDLPDRRLAILAGALEATVGPDGGAVLGHSFLIPTLYRVVGTAVVHYAAPVPDGEEPAVGWIPPAPFSEDDVMGMLAPALDLAPASGRSVLILTRSGDRREGFREKAVLEIGVPGMELVGAVRLPVNAVLLAGGGPDGVRVMDQAGGWHRCDPPVAFDPVPSRHGAPVEDPT